MDIGATRVKILGGLTKLFISKSIRDICGGLNLSQGAKPPLVAPMAMYGGTVSKL